MKSPEFRSSSVLVAFLKTSAAQMTPLELTKNASAFQTLIAAKTKAIPGEPILIIVTVIVTPNAVPIATIPGKTTQKIALHAILQKNAVL